MRYKWDISREINKNTVNNCYLKGGKLGSGEQYCNEDLRTVYLPALFESFTKWKSYYFELITLKMHISHEFELFWRVIHSWKGL